MPNRSTSNRHIRFASIITQGLVRSGLNDSIFLPSASGLRDDAHV